MRKNIVNIFKTISNKNCSMLENHKCYVTKNTHYYVACNEKRKMHIATPVHGKTVDA